MRKYSSPEALLSQTAPTLPRNSEKTKPTKAPKRPPLVRAINAVGGVMSMARLGLPRFTPDSIRRSAEKISGFSDYGTNSYVPGLATLCHSLENEAELNQMGRIILHRQISYALAGRLTVVAWEKAFPKQAEAPIEAPLFVIGLPRTGTTILYETLAADPSLRAPLTWECRDFALAHQAAADPENDPRVKKLGRQMAQVDRLMPGFTAIHKFGPFIPTECIGLMLLDMASEQFGSLAWLPSYRDFLLNNDFSSVYEWHKRGLRYLQATQPSKTWMLKSPLHTGYLEALLTTYPDARLIQTHRNPMKVISSVASLYKVSRGGWSDAEYDLPTRAYSDAAYYAEFVRRATEFRQTHPEHADRFFDVPFEGFMSDPMKLITEMHAYFDRPLTDAAHKAMADYLTDRPRDKYGRHKYTPEEFGFTDALRDDLFSDYLKQFGSLT
ncbi:MAG: sulfotransferase [Pseudomonadota bacterium]